ncbi:MAG: MFS transporter [Parvibaculum sp.]|uniref:MFS transporter n=1 Tax=Parvibaculum sp. TaxID=2024848 RepID=UPI0025DC8F43|nr:MFS transporter [Parvibaculum sp.]MCE9651237.1 MFS transporter [Parvibaculum sp.]
MTLSRLPRPHPDAVRFVPFFIGLNFLNGIHVVFFTAWLASVGFTPYSTGLLLASMGVLRVFTGPVLGVAADAFHARRLFLIVLMGVAGLCYVGYAAFSGPAFVVAFSLIASAAFSAIGALIEGVTLRAATMRGFDYGRVRLWGSLAFVAMNFFGGAVVAAAGIESFLPILIGSAFFALCGGFVLPREELPAVRASARSVGRDALALARQPLFMLMTAATGIAQASHTFYYSFGTLNWQSLHYDARLIGLLWALGVIAEIVLLMFSGRVVARIGAVNLMMLGAAAGIVRWTIVALSPPLWLLIPIQFLHAGTFCAVHLGSMHFILRATPPHLIGTAQSIYAAVTIGVFFSIGQYGSGVLFGAHGSLGYLAMTGFSAVALLLSHLLGRLWDGGVLPVRAPA